MKHPNHKTLRILLISAVAAMALFLLGADFPEHHAPDLTAKETAAAFCNEFSPEFRASMEKTAAENPYLILQLIAE